MNVKAEKQLTIKEILNTIQNTTLTESRRTLYIRIGAMVTISGTVLKKITRHQKLKLLIRPDESPAESSFQIFAEFEDKDAATIHAAKIRKSSKIKMAGQFQASGTSAVNLNFCKFRGRK